MEKVTSGYTYNYKICPSDGWKINCVTFNGNDVTELLDENQTFTTPIITENSILNASFVKSEENSIRKMNQGSLKVYSIDNVLYVKNIKANDSIRIFDVNGRLYQTIPVGRGEYNMILPMGNVYIVKGKYDTIKIKL
jgi:hypothetical protein